ncbi:lactonase family protein [Fredinandcohnia sp. QZ13]|uniref:lactonase family protein n=1 Tax=Fredinandcohnia sp. QZ13 TaxID=3073144 RepID=UPI00285305BC|nr:lactonase family protein [Fredinandcohnia sp. QZ13]MDR4890387.1 lactonase family protein [Fredinandcohnia sp. QZ13]
MSKFIGYVGTYTKGDSKGIYSFTLDTVEQKISDVKLAAELGNPTYVTVSQNNRFLYSVVKDGEAGGVAAYSVNSHTGELKSLNNDVSEGASPCHVSVNKANNQVVTGNYHKGTIELYSVNSESGSIESSLSVVAHEGTGPHERQEKPHTHYSGFTPDEKYVVAIDLGIDKLITYDIKDGALKEVNSLSVRPGSGPRHIAFHPNGKYAYIMTEISNEVVALSYESSNGSFTELQYISTIPEDYTENSQGSAIHISKDGKFVYAGNRGHNSIAVFEVNEATGELTLVEMASSGGDWPRDFVFDPSEKFIVGSNQESSNLVLYARDEQTGKLTLIDSDITVPYPVCVKFLHV